MSAADFLLAPEVQKLLRVVFSEPDKPFTIAALSKATKLDAGDVVRTQAHLVDSGILNLHKADSEEGDSVSANTSFIFYAELRRIAIKSFAAAEPIRAMLRSKFKSSVLRAFVLGEDEQGVLELLVVHGQLVPDESDMSAACRKLSASIGRHLKVHVISSNNYAALTARDYLGVKLANGAAIEVIGEGDTKAKPQVERKGLLQSARKKLAALAR
ncbi:hypothetical protein BH10PSE18_BH10PSE18_29660 [soil metagenome]